MSVENPSALHLRLEAHLKEERESIEYERELLRRLEEKEAAERALLRGLEDAFAASLPRVMKETHGIVVRPDDARVRTGEIHGPRFSFVAPCGEVALVGEVKIHFVRGDMFAFVARLEHIFRDLFPECAHLPLYGVVAGGVIDEDAERLARKLGFIILRLENGEVRPVTGKDYQPKKF